MASSNVRVAQALVFAINPSVGGVADGVWGPVSHYAYRMSPSEARAEVDAILARDGTSSARLNDAYLARQVATAGARSPRSFKTLENGTRQFGGTSKVSPIRPKVSREPDYNDNRDIGLVVDATPATLPDPGDNRDAGLDTVRPIRDELFFAGSRTPAAATPTRRFVPSPVLKVVKPSGRIGWISAADMVPIIARVSIETGVSVEVIQKFLDLEAQTDTRGGLREYNRLAVNAQGFSGLFQFDGRGDAWRVSARHVTGLGPFHSSWRDAYQNTLAAAGYLLANTKTVRNGLTVNGFRYQFSGPITGNVAYLMHNQGALGMMQIVAGKKQPLGRQSPKAVAVANAAVTESQDYI